MPRPAPLKWRKDWSKEIDTSGLFTGTAMSPIIDSGLLIVHVGDDDAGALRALDPATGDEKWTLPGHGPGYASPIVTTFGGVRQLVTMTDKAVVGIEVQSGKPLWTIPFPDLWNENIVTPVVAGDILIVSGARKGTYGYRLEKTGAGFARDRGLAQHRAAHAHELSGRRRHVRLRLRQPAQRPVVLPRRQDRGREMDDRGTGRHRTRRSRWRVRTSWC